MTKENRVVTRPSLRAQLYTQPWRNPVKINQQTKIYPNNYFLKKLLFSPYIQHWYRVCYSERGPGPVSPVHVLFWGWQKPRAGSFSSIKCKLFTNLFKFFSLNRYKLVTSLYIYYVSFNKKKKLWNLGNKTSGFLGKHTNGLKFKEAINLISFLNDSQKKKKHDQNMWGVSPQVRYTLGLRNNTSNNLSG